MVAKSIIHLNPDRTLLEECRTIITQAEKKNSRLSNKYKQFKQFIKQLVSFVEKVNFTSNPIKEKQLLAQYKLEKAIVLGSETEIPLLEKTKASLLNERLTTEEEMIVGNLVSEEFQIYLNANVAMRKVFLRTIFMRISTL